jgi:hypothetical protein
MTDNIDVFEIDIPLDWADPDNEDILFAYEADPNEYMTTCNACFGTGLDRVLDADCLVCWGEGMV